MSPFEGFLWAVGALIVDLITLAIFGRSWVPVIIVSIVIIALFLLRQAFCSGLFRDYRGKLINRFGPIQASIYGLEWQSRLSNRHGQHCDMYVFPKHVVFVTPDPLGKEKVHIFDVELSHLGQVRLTPDGKINITVHQGQEVTQLQLKSSLSHSELIKPLETLQSELIHERKVEVLRKVSEKVKQLDEERHRQLEVRRRVRIEKLNNGGSDLVRRFAEIVPQDIFIKDTLFDKIKELLMLELLRHKSTLQGRLEDFIDNDFKPFAEIMRDKAGFDFEDFEDFSILLNAIREKVRRNVEQEFLTRYSSVFTPSAALDEQKMIDVFIRACGTGAQDLKNLEGLRLLLFKRGHNNNFKGLRTKVEIATAGIAQEVKKHSLERRINSGHPFFTEVADLDFLDTVEFAEFVKGLMVNPGDEVLDIILKDDTRVELVINSDQKIIVHALKQTGSVESEDITGLLEAKSAINAESAIFLTTSYFTNRALELAAEKGVVTWDRQKLQQEISPDKAKQGVESAVSTN